MEMLKQHHLQAWQIKAERDNFSQEEVAGILMYMLILAASNATTRKLLQRPEITVSSMTGKSKTHWRITAVD